MKRYKILKLIISLKYKILSCFKGKVVSCNFEFQVLYATEDGFAVPEDEAGLDDGVPPPPHPDEVAEEY